jgi:hypothetical protein
MSRILDNAPVGVEPPDKAERRDIQVERESEEYQVMCDTVRMEWAQFKLDGMAVHNEAMRRLKEKYAQE